MSFQQGLSGLSASSKALDVISNNVANSSTVGFKSADAHFADVFAASMTSGAAQQIGIGTTLSAVAQQFTQGNITTTNNPLDIAINGNGFFRLSNNGVITYSRNGQFHLDNSGYFINDQGLRLTGYPAAQDGTINKQQPTEIQMTPELLKLDPVATGQGTGSSYHGVQMSVNLDSRTTGKTFDSLQTTPNSTPTDTDPTDDYAAGIQNIDASTYNYSTAVSVYDSLGNPHTMTMYFVKTDTPGVWNVYSNTDGTSMMDPAKAASDATADDANFPSLTTPLKVKFDEYGQLEKIYDPADATGTATLYDTTTNPVTGTPEFTAQINLDQVADNLGRTRWGADPNMTFKVSLAGTTQYGATFATNRLQQDGFSSGNLAGLAVGADGVIQGRYSNGQTRNIGQLVLASFQNPNGLTNIGGNQWVQTSVSGEPTIDAPGSGQLGVVQSNAVEESNVDLTTELVKMITQQRNYQANAQSIKTQDQIMQTLMSLR